MRFLVDECTGPAVARWLRGRSHDVFSVYEESRGMADESILDKARSENWILITNDKDFGEKVYRVKQPHHGVIFLRLQDERAGSKIEALEKLLDRYEDQLADAFVVLPGGVGTLEEFFETWTWAQLGVHRKPVGLLDVAGYWRSLIALLEHAEAEGFMRGTPRDWLVMDTDPARLLDRLASFKPPQVRRWLHLGET